MSTDDDIIAGSLQMSLESPVGVSPQSRLCPVCENVLDWREPIIYRFFTEILEPTSDSVDDVLVEADGEWSIVDKKYSAKVASGVPFLAPYDYIDSDSD
ncbi:hypothetical protein DFH08DRAFT_974688 [Mycena albidolilacea]|uniref:Uncharacterized protein n=1 Tax=Mycena albidolilacea TaxID=1033008 RepID=A0AAD6Z645_9AGAR|nr:hypothetical protein DFH08DRAFT_974688 [Mycena albidolilacea]